MDWIRRQWTTIEDYMNTSLPPVTPQQSQNQAQEAINNERSWLPFAIIGGVILLLFTLD